MRVPFCICLLVLLASLVAGQAPYTRRTPRRGGRCVGPPLAGPCLAVIPKWFYNAETKDCEQFIYGGCGGNPRNRFDSKADCQRICIPNSTPTGGECSGVENDGGIICEFPLRRWFYDPGTKACQECVYCGCQGGNKYFQTRQACEAKCVLTASPSPQPIPSSSPSVVVCQLKPDPGPCKGYGLRWYFDKSSGRCERFVYGLCQGNGNNFQMLNECQKACRKDCAYATCFANPCDVTKCEGYPEAECVANYCNGCSADFYVEQRRVQCGPPPSPAGQCIKETGTCRQQNALFGTTAPDNEKPTPCCKGTTCCVCPPGNIPVDYEPPEDPTGTCEKRCVCPP